MKRINISIKETKINLKTFIKSHKRYMFKESGMIFRKALSKIWNMLQGLTISKE